MITRGIKHKVDKFINELSGKYFPFKAPKFVVDQMVEKQTAGKNLPPDQIAAIRSAIENNPSYTQLALRPIQLWEVVFPEDYLDEVVTTLATTHPSHYKKPKGYKGKWFAKELKRREKYIYPLRKVLKAVKIPWDKITFSKFRIVDKTDVEVQFIGMRKDAKDETGRELL